MVRWACNRFICLPLHYSGFITNAKITSPASFEVQTDDLSEHVNVNMRENYRFKISHNSIELPEVLKTTLLRFWLIV